MIEVTDTTFEQEVLNSTVPVFVDFWAPWCGPCKAMSPNLEALASEYGEKVKFVKVNVDDNPKLTKSFGVRGVPLIVTFKNNNVKDTFVGARPKVQLTKMVEDLIT